MALKCEECGRIQSRPDAKYCEACPSANLTSIDGAVPSPGEAVFLDYQTELANAREATFEAVDALTQELLALAANVKCFTTEVPVGYEVESSIGLCFGNSSKQAFWGLSTQANRLSRAYEAALLNLTYDAASRGANGVVGIQFALNNSSGSGNAFLTGSSEAVMLVGTAVILKN